MSKARRRCGREVVASKKRRFLVINQLFAISVEKKFRKVALSRIHLNFNEIFAHKNLKSATTKKFYEMEIELGIKSDSKQQKRGE